MKPDQIMKPKLGTDLNDYISPNGIPDEIPSEITDFKSDSEHKSDSEIENMDKSDD